MRRNAVLITIAMLSLAACSDTAGPLSGDRIAIRFATVAAASSSAGLSANSSMDELVIDGSNGSLRITDLRLVVNEFELERTEQDCDATQQSDLHDDDECEEFESGPFFVDLPLGGAVSVITQEVPAGTYEELEFEVKDIDMDDDEDDGMSGGLNALLQAMRDAGFAEWPKEASMVVVGTFTPTGGTPRAFTAFLDAEIEIEMEFEPPMTVQGEPLTVDIEVNPALWFHNADTNKVLDLSAFDWNTTHKLAEFEANLKRGFSKIDCDS
jgi:hypothetical protein